MQPLDVVRFPVAVLLALVLEALVLQAPVLLALVLEALVDVVQPVAADPAPPQSIAWPEP